MLTKPFIFVLTFMLTIANFIILLIPVAVVAFPIFMFFESLFLKAGVNVLYFLVSRISFLMIAYMVLDFIFGFTVRRVNKRAIPIKKATSIYGHEDIDESFNWLKKKFNMPKVELYIDQNFQVVNAYAVGSLRKKSVTITLGLITQIKEKSANHTQFVDAIKGILGHEMSHLSNSDYMPGMLASANEIANRHVSSLIRWCFIIIANFLRFVPFLGKPVYRLIVKFYNFLNFVLGFFYNWIFMPVYNFLKKWFGRSIEYRCDRESSYAFGGKRMALGLSMLGDGGYFSLFSTHPRTKSRIKNVEGIIPKSGIVRPSIMGGLSNFISIVLVLFVCVYSTERADIPGVYQHYMTEVHYPVKASASRFIQNINEMYYLYIK